MSGALSIDLEHRKRVNRILIAFGAHEKSDVENYNTVRKEAYNNSNI